MDKRARWSIGILAGASVLLAVYALGRAGVLPTWAWLGTWWPALVSVARPVLPSWCSDGGW